MFNDDFKRRVRDASDIVRVIESAVGKLTRAGRNLKACCPFHNEKTPSFNIDPEGQYFKCFGCGKGGDVFTFVMLHERCEFREALEILAERAGIPIETDRRRRSSSAKDTDWKSALYKLNNAAASFFSAQLFSPAGKMAREYLKKRGLSDEMVQRFRLGYAPAGGSPLMAKLTQLKAPVKALLAAGLLSQRDEGPAFDFFRDRLMFPIRDIQGRVIAFGGRVLGDGEPKYLNTRETSLFKKERTVYAIDAAREAIVESKTAILVEGYTDVMMCHQHGITNVVACLGTAITPEHMRQLRRVCDQLILLTDADKAGATASERAIGVLFQEQMPAKIARLPGGDKDPCDFLQADPVDGVKRFRRALEHGMDLFDFKFERVRGRHDIATALGQASAAKELMESISLIPDSLLKNRYRKEVHSRLSLGSQWSDINEADLKFEPQRAPRAAAEPGATQPGGEAGGEMGILPAPEHETARQEREVLRFLFHEPAWMDAAVGCVDLATLEGGPERLVGMALLDGMAAGLLPPDASTLADRSAGSVVARQVIGWLQDADTKPETSGIGLDVIAGATQVAIDLAERPPATTKLEAGQRLDMVIRPLRLVRLKRQHETLGREWSKAQAAEPGSAEAAQAEPVYQELVRVRKEMAEVKSKRENAAGSVM